MKRFKNILYFADGATEPCHALQRAVDLADSNEARLTLIDVIKPYPVSAALERRLGFSIEKHLQAIRLDELDALAGPFQRSDQLIYTRVLSGIPFVEIIRAVQQNGFDLVIKAARSAEGLGEHLLGSTDLHLLRKCPCPVWIDQPTQQGAYRSILAAVDPTRAFEQAQLIMDLAISLAHSERADLEVLHAWRLEGETLLRSGRGRIPERELEMLLETERDKHRQPFDRLLAPYGLDSGKPNVQLVKGRATASILDRAQHADLVIMGTLGRTGIPGFIIGNTAENVLHNTRSSILAVKPEGFRTPVEAPV
jgi:universal stress protein E